MSAFTPAFVQFCETNLAKKITAFDTFMSCNLVVTLDANLRVDCESIVLVKLAIAFSVHMFKASFTKKNLRNRCILPRLQYRIRYKLGTLLDSELSE